MKIEIDSFSGAKVYPGRGTLFVRGDSRIFRFQSSKTASLFHQRLNPRKISWTVVYRKQHKKGITEEVAKKRTRKTVKNLRAVGGASVEVLKEKRRAGISVQSKTQAAQAAKKKERADKAKSAVAHSRGAPKVSKQQAKGAQQKVQATSR
ncbi:60S ribosomal protein eL24 [Magnusiomyces paraingens]|uniref:Large ribosomal subunit protein eL24-related N-terminal domain-containing protein n=1 Tax=Magnusiomyces paraingens TaxID=2606893 RepID=A0A5E8C7K3_9ASCO|nr:uncharacterized protein SAPINGB_P005582 [Saprochaete ingens]VVT57196.1 unnamed protein product [Saprochaete ingens]